VATRSRKIRIKLSVLWFCTSTDKRIRQHPTPPWPSVRRPVAAGGWQSHRHGCQRALPEGGVGTTAVQHHSMPRTPYRRRQTGRARLSRGGCRLQHQTLSTGTVRGASGVASVDPVVVVQRRRRVGVDYRNHMIYPSLPDLQGNTSLFTPPRTRRYGASGLPTASIRCATGFLVRS